MKKTPWTKLETLEIKKRIGEGIVTTVDMMKYFPTRSQGSVCGKMQRVKTKGGKSVKLPVKNTSLKANNGMHFI